ncbi:hypothetical protein QBC36DRAFT_348522 [Triangularia setosa]|uniref:Hemerythrin-like domain-containing protein n=1 Tax=Triangularia setosa TaxID=2587417 RepID=A0AAN6W1L7_9PEZI|nr:hypothetical protein QBC36DRAFT_348522 [Podospora setosa]
MSSRRHPYAARHFSASVRPNTSISEAITKDHREIKKYYNEQCFGNQFTWELARHSVAEELIVYLAFESHMGEKCHTMAENDRKHNHRAKELLKKFQNMKAESVDSGPKLRELWSILSQHIKEKENNDFPALEAALQSAKGQSEGMAKKFGLTKALVPSQSHPSAGDNPYFELAMDMLAALIDHIANIFRKFPENTTSPNPSTK